MIKKTVLEGFGMICVYIDVSLPNTIRSARNIELKIILLTDNKIEYESETFVEAYPFSRQNI